MRYRQIQPGEAASNLIECYWTLETDEGESSVQRIVPDGTPELILNLRNPFESRQGDRWQTQPRCFFAGQITGPLLVRSAGPAKILGVRFRPYAARRLFGTPMYEVTGATHGIDDLCPALSLELETAMSLRTTAGQIAAIESALVRQAGVESDELVARSVESIIRSGGTSDLGRLASDLGCSLRQLERRFLDNVGILPKLFARIQRFQRVFHAMEGGRRWVDAAVECGYYDQAHLIRDFKDFSGETPTALQTEADLAEHFLRYSGMSLFSNTATPAGG